MNKFIALLLVLSIKLSFSGTYYVATNGSNSTGNGSIASPWATIGYAANQIPDDGSTIVVKSGIYEGSISLSRNFTKWVTIKSEFPYLSRITNTNTGTVRVFYITGSMIIIDGFELYNKGPIPADYSSRGEYLVHITGPAKHVVMRNCILHDNYINDMIKINSGASKINFENNICYNQGRDLAYLSPKGFQHMDINKVDSVEVTDCIFFNDYPNDGNSKTCNGSFIVCKNSSATFGNFDNSFKRNIFLNYQGPPDQSMLLVGEDAHAPNYDLINGLIENCLFIGNSSTPCSGAFSIKGCKDITFRSNTVVGNLPVGSWAYAGRVVQETGEPKVDGAYYYNNIWCDPTGTMTDFSQGNDTQSVNVLWRNNLYWNGGSAIPQTGTTAHWININSDTNHIFADPLLTTNQSGLVLPKWDTITDKFTSGNSTIRDEFVRLVNAYGALPSASPAIDTAESVNSPADDILGNTRGSSPDVGCFEYSSSTAIFLNHSASKSPFSIYPNPFHLQFKIKIAPHLFGQINIELLDISGRVVYSKTDIGTNKELVISPDNLPAGMYLLRVASNDYIWHERIVKNN